MTQAWTHDVAGYLLDEGYCPRCGARLAGRTSCPTCLADLSTPEAIEIRDHSRVAVDALTKRQQSIDRLPSVRQAAPAVAQASPASRTGGSASGAAAGPAAAPAGTPATAATPSARSSVSVQSVMAVAGAGLVAVAAIVFTFLNPDLTDFGTRTLIVGIVTAVFLGSAWGLGRAGLQFSAEAVGALGMVFVVLDIWAFSTLAHGISGWYFGALGTLFASGVMILIAALARIRTWLWTGLVGLTLVPAFVGYATADPWLILLGYLGAGVVALLLHDAARRLAPRFGAALLPERVTATLVELLAVGLALLQLFALPYPQVFPDVVGVSAVILGLAVLAMASTRTIIRKAWSYLTGALIALAFAVLPFAIAGMSSVWLLCLLPAAAAVAVLLVSALPFPRTVDRRLLLPGVWSVALAFAVPALVTVIARVVLPSQWWLAGGVTRDDPELSALLGVSAVTAGCGILWFFARRSVSTAALAQGSLVTGLWLGMLGLLDLVDGRVLPATARAVLGLLIAVALALAVALIPRVREARLRMRVPIAVGAHVILVAAAAIGWTDSNLTVAIGAAAVAALVALARAVPHGVRPLHLAVGYAYALVVFAAGLNLVHVETIAVLCLTTTLASVAALASTLIRRIDARSWYAVLIVTIVPFLIGIGSVLAVRSGWTALSTGVTFLLALTLLLTRRPGLNRIVRAMAASLLVPTLAVVVICLGAQFLATSGSPVTLPIIAVIVACTLPSVGLIGAALERHGIPAVQAASARLWIELSSWLTAALAVVLALVRVAAGLGTTFLVLLIIGLGAAAMARYARRRYGWILAYASWTGALWCLWALAGVAVAEPYILPPALIAAAIGAVLVARGRPGVGIPAIGLFSVALASAIVPSLVIFAVVGDGTGGQQTWRCLALVAASVVLLVLGALVRRIPSGSRAVLLGRLRAPLLVMAMVAAAAGPVQAVRWGLRLDPVGLADPTLLMLPSLGVSAATAGLVAVAARLLPAADGSGAVPSTAARRWRYAPALVFLVAGPIASIRDGAVAILTLYGLGFALLALVIVTVLRARTRAVSLPPVWFTFLLAWCVMVASWSAREILRVEAYSLPMGLAVLAAGVIAMRGPTVEGRADATSWPVGFHGSWRLLTPGLVVALLPSMLATGTDPQTWRAILVLGLALVAILIGSLRKLGAPFVIGLVVLPIENIIVFSVQVGRSIGATPWWITLATAGAVLLVIAVTSERRSAGQKGVGARLRDLR
ncbi:SCO7613 C-terminal domain-containing membrane protein [Lysinimonas soli]|uniref:SCO7613 C-terminal domain-containing membrane protein n=1 Tax=Lysinimonas soli TaxID=1074233 RepID=A0ABW0NQS2_9MICO